MRSLKRWLTNSDPHAEAQRALIVLVLVWTGGGLGVFVALWSTLIHSVTGLLQGVALVVFAIAVRLQEPRR